MVSEYKHYAYMAKHKVTKTTKDVYGKKPIQSYKNYKRCLWEKAHWTLDACADKAFFCPIFKRFFHSHLHSAHKHTKEGYDCNIRTSVVFEYWTCNYSSSVFTGSLHTCMWMNNLPAMRQLRQPRPNWTWSLTKCSNRNLRLLERKRNK